MTTIEHPERTLVIERVFDAPRELVYSAWIDGANIDKWWGPSMMTTKTVERNFEVGGAWKYEMFMPVKHGQDRRKPLPRNSRQRKNSLERTARRRRQQPGQHHPAIRRCWRRNQANNADPPRFCRAKRNKRTRWNVDGLQHDSRQLHRIPRRTIQLESTSQLAEHGRKICLRPCLALTANFSQLHDPLSEGSRNKYIATLHQA